MIFQLLSNHLTEHYCNKILMPKDATTLLVSIASQILADDQLVALYNDFYLTHIDSDYWTTAWEPLSIHPYVDEKFGKHASLFYLHAALEKLPFAEKRYSELGISEEIFIETLRDISTWVTNAYNLVGYYCIRNIGWIWRHLEAKLFRLGRLQYMPIEFKDNIHSFIHKQTGETLLLCGDGMEIRANGDLQGVCHKEKTLDGFVSSFTETSSHYIGHPITPYGKGLSETLSLSKAEWTHALKKGDYILDIHIPKDGDFSITALQSSYQMAKNFFSCYFPKYNLKGMYCGTWLFTPQLQEILPTSSKIVKFQRLFYLYPHAGSKQFAWNFVFNDLVTPETATPKTYLQKQVLEYVTNERELFDLKGIYLDVSGEFGSYSYMDEYDKHYLKN